MKFDKEDMQELAKALVPELHEALKDSIVEGLKAEGYGPRQELYNFAQLGVLFGKSKNAISHMFLSGALPVPTAMLGGIQVVRRVDLEKYIGEKLEYVKDRINIRRETEEVGGTKEDDMWTQLVDMFYNYLPPVPRSAFIDDAAHQFYKKYRQEMLLEACIDPFSDVMSAIMDEIKDALVQANKEEKELKLIDVIQQPIYSKRLSNTARTIVDSLKDGTVTVDNYEEKFSEAEAKVATVQTKLKDGKK